MDVNIKSDRQIWIDTLKGIGIIIVVAGHIGGIIPESFGLIRMPLFLFVAGFLFKPSPDWKGYLYKKIIHLLVPYICFLFLIYTPQAIMNVHKGNDTWIEAIARPLIGGPFLFGWTAVFWFITCLFFVQQLMNLLLNRYSEKRVIIIMAISLAISYINSEIFPKVWLPWSLNAVFAAAPIFYVGYLYKKYVMGLNSYYYMILLLILLVSLSYPGNSYNIKTNFYGIPIITFVSAIFAIVALTYIAKMLEKRSWSSKPFTQLSKGSMIIMYLHQPLQYSANTYLSMHNPYIRLVIVISVCLIAYYLISQTTVGRGLLLGSVNDFKRVLSKNPYPKIVTSKS
ncbi:acyltransferase family protein [Parapedobacter tibetensis]|uniref:acyltransferase family protein n=1 Tax=Parapedobacter tibetensis TaxID=2972951 RepID=UPI00214D2558|nr:acyltransferase family protein [Parapedobacter tibetensis]